MVKQATTIAIPGNALKPWICRIADERTASPALDAAIASQENDVPREADQRAQRQLERTVELIWLAAVVIVLLAALSIRPVTKDIAHQRADSTRA
jgi:hypothetical protein